MRLNTKAAINERGVSHFSCPTVNQLPNDSLGPFSKIGVNRLTNGQMRVYETYPLGTKSSSNLAFRVLCFKAFFVRHVSFLERILGVLVSRQYY